VKSASFAAVSCIEDAFRAGACRHVARHVARERRPGSLHEFQRSRSVIGGDQPECLRFRKSGAQSLGEHGAQSTVGLRTAHVGNDDAIACSECVGADERTERTDAELTHRHVGGDRCDEGT
jgi:hypothetical protein